jgi:4-hydroxy-2-oxoheptanedioate aldolase
MRPNVLPHGRGIVADGPPLSSKHVASFSSAIQPWPQGLASSVAALQQMADVAPGVTSLACAPRRRGPTRISRAPHQTRMGEQMRTRLQEVWSRGAVAVNGWLSIPSTVTAEMVARQDYDTITIDLQHGLIDYQMALPMMQAVAAASDATVIARPPWNEPGIIMKLLDAGALGILCPLVNTPADAEALVRTCRYAPAGIRSVGPTRAMMVYGANYIQEANDAVITLAMIETAQALDNVEAIARTPGLSALYIGPSDLAQSLGHPIRVDPTDAPVMAAIDRIREAAKAAGIKAGMHCMMPDYARQMAARGFDFVTLGNDARMLTAELAARVGAFRA